MPVVIDGAGTITGLVYSLDAKRILRVNEQTISENLTLPADKNAITAGPVTVATGYTVTVLGNWTVV
jgi:hypothetical protein